MLGCSAPVSGLCYPAIASCIYLDGPVNGTTVYVSATPAALSAVYNVQVSWEVRWLSVSEMIRNLLCLCLLCKTLA